MHLRLVMSEQKKMSTSVATARDRSRRLPNQDMADAGSICSTARYTAAAKPSQSSSFSGTPATPSCYHPAVAMKERSFLPQTLCLSWGVVPFTLAHSCDGAQMRLRGELEGRCCCVVGLKAKESTHQGEASLCLRRIVRQLREQQQLLQPLELRWAQSPAWLHSLPCWPSALPLGAAPPPAY